MLEYIEIDILIKKCWYKTCLKDSPITSIFLESILEGTANMNANKSLVLLTSLLLLIKQKTLLSFLLPEFFNACLFKVVYYNVIEIATVTLVYKNRLK